jgi:hypothetical protein
MKNRTIILTLAFAFVALTFSQCSKDEIPAGEDMGQMTLKITDAPSDDTSISGTFITVSDVKVDGVSVEGFSKQTFEISALQNGATRTLFNGEVKAKNYSKVTLVLDMAADASGNAPGCYILDKTNKKHDLRASANQAVEIDLQKSIDVNAGSQTSVIVDFDLRKAISRGNAAVSQSEYSFVSTTELNNSFRIVFEEKTGSLKGKVQGSILADKNVVVYAYKKGTFTAATETQAQGSGQVRFTGAVTSANVDQNGDYHLAFLEEGNYEIYLASYSKDASGKVQFHGLLTVSSLTSGLLLNNVSVAAKASVTVNISITGLLS